MLNICSMNILFISLNTILKTIQGPKYMQIGVCFGIYGFALLYFLKYSNNVERYIFVKMRAFFW